MPKYLCVYTSGQCDSQLCGKRVEVDLGNYLGATNSELRLTVAKSESAPVVVTALNHKC